MRIRVKFCGITSIEDRDSAIRAGADAIGLVFFKDSPRFVSLEKAERIAKDIPPFVSAEAFGVLAAGLLRMHRETDVQTGKVFKRNAPAGIENFKPENSTLFVDVNQQSVADSNGARSLAPLELNVQRVGGFIKPDFHKSYSLRMRYPCPSTIVTAWNKSSGEFVSSRCLRLLSF